MEPIRVLQVFGIMNRAGAETFIMNVYRNIDRSKVQFDFLVYKQDRGDYDSEIEQLGGNIYRVSPLQPRTFFNYKKDLELFFDEHPEYKIVHSHLDTLSTFTLDAAKQAGVPVRIAHSHTTTIPLSYKTLFQVYSKMLINKKCTHQFACSKKAMNWLFGEKSLNMLSSRVINNGIDVKTFRYRKDIRNNIRSSLGFDDKFIIGNVGNFIKTKNQEFLIEVFNEVCKEIPNSILLLIGRGPLEDSLKQQVAKLGLDNKVVFLGSRNDVHELMQVLDVLVHPSLYEGFPVTLVEAQTAGLPCIVSKSVSEDVKITDLVNFISLEEPVSKWSEEIKKTRDIDRKVYDDDIIQAGFDIKSVAKGLEDFYVNNHKLQ